MDVNSSAALLKALNFMTDTGSGLNRTIEPVKHLPTLGTGSSSTVKENIRSEGQGRAFAFKVSTFTFPPREDAPPQDSPFDSFLNGAHILSFRPIRDHENIVGLSRMLWAIQSQEPVMFSLALEIERAHFGDLETFLKSDAAVTWTQRKMLCADVANGTSILHTSNVVHGALTPKHVLIFAHPTRRYIAKLSGFGNAIVLTDARSWVQIPGFDPLWSAPEAANPVPVDQAKLTDLFSMGLLLWSILAKADHFSVFDTPLDKDARATTLRKVLLQPYLFRLIPIFIEKTAGILPPDEILVLTSLFSCTIRTAPRQRSMAEVLEILNPFAGYSNGTPRNQVKLIKPMEHGLAGVNTVTFTTNAIAELHPLFQPLVIQALSQLCGFGSSGIPMQPRALQKLDFRAREDLVWTLFKCYIEGVGTPVDYQMAVNILYQSTMPHYNVERSKLLLLLLHDALADPGPGRRSIDFSTMQLDTAGIPRCGPWYRATVRTIEERQAHHGIEKSADYIIQMVSTAREGADLSEVMLENENTILHGCTVYGLTAQATRLILDHNVDINAVNDRNDTCLNIACQEGNFGMAELLISHGADPSIANVDEESPLFWLGSFEEDEKRKLGSLLRSQGADVHSALEGDQNGNWKFAPLIREDTFFLQGKIMGSPLLRAIGNRDLPTVKLLLNLLSRDLAPIPEHSIKVMTDLFMPRALRLACELHLFDVLEVIFTELRRLFPGVQSQDVSLLGNLFAHLGMSSVLILNVLRTDRHVYRLCYHKSSWEVAQAKTISVLANFGFLQPHTLPQGLVGVLNSAIVSENSAALAHLLTSPDFADQVNALDDVGMTPAHHALNTGKYYIFELVLKHGAIIDVSQLSTKHNSDKHRIKGSKKLGVMKQPKIKAGDIADLHRSLSRASFLHGLASQRIRDPRFARLILEQGAPANSTSGGKSALTMALMRGNFELAEQLVHNGASLVHEENYLINPSETKAITVLGSLFLPAYSQQFDDLTATLRFILRYDGYNGQSVFIVDKSHGLSVLHFAASCPEQDEDFEQLITILLKHFNAPHCLNAQAQNAARSTPLQSAVALHNYVATEAFVRAGADLSLLDRAGHSIMDIAEMSIGRLVSTPKHVLYGDHKKKLEQALNIVEILVRYFPSNPFLYNFNLPKKNVIAIKTVIKKMMSLEHRTQYVRELEANVFGLMNRIVSGNSESIVSDALVCRKLNQIISPVLQAEQIFRVIDRSSPSPPKSFPDVRRRIPWCNSLSNTALGQLQQAAAFEWLIEQVIKTPDLNTNPDDPFPLFLLEKYARSRQPVDLPFNPALIKWPVSLLDWYVTNIENESVEFSPGDESDIKGFLAILQQRSQAHALGQTSLPPFSDHFRRLHFELLQPSPLRLENIAVGIIRVVRCRCAQSSVGDFTWYDTLKFSQTVWNYDEQQWAKKICDMKDESQLNLKQTIMWKQLVGNRSDVVETHTKLLRSKNSQAEVPFQPRSPPRPRQLNHPAYRPLNPDRQEIRLLELLPARDRKRSSTETVYCLLHYVSLKDVSEAARDTWKDGTTLKTNRAITNGVNGEENHRPSSISAAPKRRFVWGGYTALSYVWGDPKITRQIIVDGVPVAIGANLESALRSLRQESQFTSGLYLWADAICINQNDVQERNHQVSIMHQIYSEAEMVTAWLGDGDEQSRYSLQTLNDFAETLPEDLSDPFVLPRTKVEPVNTPDALRDYAINVGPALVNLMDRPYWMRLWIMQELAIGAMCTNIYIGPEKISYNELIKVVKHCVGSGAIQWTTYTDEFTWPVLHKVTYNVQQIFHRTMLADFTQSNQSFRWEVIDWHSWVQYASHAQTSDERDRVFAIRHMLSLGMGRNIQPNYSLSVAEVYRDFAKVIINYTGGLNEVLRGHGKPTLDLPSWIPDFRDLDDFNQSEWRDFNASGDEKAFFKFPENSSTLVCHGFLVDTIDGTAGPAYRNPNAISPTTLVHVPIVQPSRVNHSYRENMPLEKAILRVWSEDATYDYGSKPSLLDLPWVEGSLDNIHPSTLEDLYSAGWGNTLESDPFQCFHIYRQNMANFNLWGRPLRKFFTSKARKCPENIEEALNGAFVANKRVLFTTANGLLGSSRRPIRHGDLVYIIKGVNYPVILRPHGDGFVVIGQSYIEGLMMGEALHRSYQKPKWEEIFLRGGCEGCKNGCENKIWD